MKHIQIAILLIIAFISIQNVNGQRRNNSVRLTIIDDLEPLNYQLNAYGLTVAEYNNIKGSPYQNEDFNLGIVNSDEGTLQSFMRYNVFFDEIEVSKDKNPKNAKALPKNKNLQVKLNNRTFVYLTVGTAGNREGKYFQILSKGSKFDLLMKSDVTYVPPTYGMTSYEQDTRGKFDKNDTFYLVSKDNRFIPLPDNKRGVIKLMPTVKDEVKKYLRVQGINLKEENDVKKFIAFYNSII